MVFLRTLILLRSGDIFESSCIEEIDTTRDNKEYAEDKEKGGSDMTVYKNVSADGSATGALTTSQSF